MARSPEELKKALEVLQGGPEIYSDFVFHLESERARADTEKRRGIEEVNKRNKEAENLRKFKIAFVDRFGFDADAGDLESFAEDLEKKIKGSGKAGQFDEIQARMKKLEKELTGTRLELDNERKEKTEIKERGKRATIKAFVVDTLKEKVYGPDLVADALISSGKLSLEDDEKTVVFVDGETRSAFSAGIEKFLSERKDLVRNSQKAGGSSGAQGGNNQGGGETGSDLERVKRLRNLGRPTFAR